MRSALLVGMLATGLNATAQSGWMPLSREVERPRATAIERVGSTMHTAIRPYRSSDLQALDAKDTLRPKAALAALDRWAGRSNGRQFRWGPLADASLGFDATQAVHSDQSLMSLRVLYIVGPVLMYMAAFVLARRYPLTSSRQERIQSWIERRDLRLQAAAAPENCQARI